MEHARARPLSQDNLTEKKVVIVRSSLFPQTSNPKLQTTNGSNANKVQGHWMENHPVLWESLHALDGTNKLLLI